MDLQNHQISLFRLVAIDTCGKYIQKAKIVAMDNNIVSQDGVTKYVKYWIIRGRNCLPFESTRVNHLFLVRSALLICLGFYVLCFIFLRSASCVANVASFSGLFVRSAFCVANVTSFSGLLVLDFPLRFFLMFIYATIDKYREARNLSEKNCFWKSNNATQKLSPILM